MLELNDLLSTHESTVVLELNGLLPTHENTVVY